MPHLTSIAGRHAADRERQREASNAERSQQELAGEARSALQRAIHQRGIRCFDVLDDGEHLLSIRCGIETCARDSDVVDAVIEQQGFVLDRRRLGRYRDRFEFLPLVQERTGAKVGVVISRPGAFFRGGDAA